jgi:hypothetical protein
MEKTQTLPKIPLRSFNLEIGIDEEDVPYDKLFTISVCWSDVAVGGELTSPCSSSTTK